MRNCRQLNRPLSCSEAGPFPTAHAGPGIVHTFKEADTMNLSRRNALATGAAATAAASALLFTRSSAGQEPLTEAGVVALRDPLIAARVLIDGFKQVNKCRIALEHASLDDTRDFLALEIREHQAVRNELRQLGFAYPTRRDDIGPVIMLVGRTALTPVSSDMISVEHQIAEEAIDNFEEVLLQLEGIEVDRFVLADQLFAHYMLLNSVETFAKLASEPMLPLLDAGLRTIRRHITTISGLSTRVDRLAGARIDVIPRR
jgi:hypothetical protein